MKYQIIMTPFKNIQLQADGIVLLENGEICPIWKNRTFELIPLVYIPQEGHLLRYKYPFREYSNTYKLIFDFHRDIEKCVKSYNKIQI